MNMSNPVKYFFIFSFLFGYNNVVYSQKTDTLYLNANWQICEKPFASYYRFGKIKIDSFWYYTGRIQDFYLDGKMEMDGNYSASGEKDGQFWFFYPDGILKAKGRYAADKRTGVWEYYYPNGPPKWKIEYTGDHRNFIVHDYLDSTGNIIAKDGTGDFTMPVTDHKTIFIYNLEGEYRSGLKYGTWRYNIYLPSLKKDFTAIKEIYEKGELKKGLILSPWGGASETYRVQPTPLSPIEYPKFRITERFSKDNTSFRNTDNDQDLLDYLVTRQAPSYDAEDTSFNESYKNVLRTLNTTAITRYFNDPGKYYNGEIIFNLSDSGDIEDVEIKGNLSDKEREHMEFFIKKFKNIEEITVENIAIDAYHKIYFFTAIFAEFVPNRYLYQFPEKEFVFSVIPYDKLKQLMLEKKKKKAKKS